MVVALDVRPAHINKSEVARRSGYTLGHISRVFSGDRQPSMDCARKVADAMGMDLEQFDVWLRKMTRPDSE